jgi:hypothetical protein
MKTTPSHVSGKHIRFIVALVISVNLAYAASRLSQMVCQVQTQGSEMTAKTQDTNGARPSPPTVAELESYIENLIAANPAYQERCQAYLRSPAAFNAERESFINWRWHFSQYNQDWFLFVNFFYQMALQNRTGVYVESGANDPLRVSNTAFLDHCLGW